MPLSSGLSSSAALEVATALAVLSLVGASYPGPVLARLCQRAENEFVGANCGIMDQFISLNAEKDHALLLDCRDLSFKLAPIPDHVALVIANTMVKHSVAGGDYPTRRRESEAACAVIASHRPGVKFLRDCTPEDLEKWGYEMEPKSFLRARHVIGENLRTVAACDALLKGNMKELGRLMAEAHRSYSQDFEGSCVEADAMVALAAGFAGADRGAADGRRLWRLHDQSRGAERGRGLRRSAWRAVRGADGDCPADSRVPCVGRGASAGIASWRVTAFSILLLSECTAPSGFFLKTKPTGTISAMSTSESKTL